MPDEQSTHPTTTELLLNLPTLAQAAFWVIVVVFVGIMLASLIGGAPILMEPIVLSLLLLPARAVLSKPDKQRAAREDLAATQRLTDNGTLPRLANELNRIAVQEYGLKRPVGLVISTDPTGVEAVCSWRRDYLFIGHGTAKNMAKHMDTKPGAVRAIFLHELAHIAHRDNQRVGYAGELLRSCVTILPWWILFLTFWLAAATNGIAAALSIDLTQIPGISPSFGEALNDTLLPDAATRAAILERANQTNLASILIFVFLSFLPIVAIGSILYLFYWRWMIRLQEHYADMAARQRGATELQLSWAIGFGIPMKTTLAGGVWGLISRLRARLRPKKIKVNVNAKPPRRAGLFAMHPTKVERSAVFAQPALIYTDWKRVTWSAAVLSLALDVIFASPLFIYHAFPLHMYTVTTLMLLSTWLLPHLVTGQPFGPNLARALTIIIGVRFIWIVLNIAVLIVQILFFPANAIVVLNALVIASSRYTSLPTQMPYTDPVEGLTMIFPAILLEMLQVGGLLAGVGLYIWWMRRTPANAPPSAIRRRHWTALLAITIITYLLMWPLANLARGI